MDRETQFINKLWNNRKTRLIMISLIMLQALLVFSSAGKELYLIAKPVYTWATFDGPSKNESASIRHSFIAGHNYIELYKVMKANKTNNWPQVFNGFKNRLEASLIALKFKNTDLVSNLKSGEAVASYEQLFRLGTLIEGHLDARGENELTAFMIGVNFSVILNELAEPSPSNETLTLYLKLLKNDLASLEKTSQYELSDIVIKDHDPSTCCNQLLISTIENFDLFRNKVGAERML